MADDCVKRIGGLLTLVLLVLASPHLLATQLDQVTLKKELEEQLIRTAAELTGAKSSNIEALIWDNRLKIIDCEEEYLITFPFSDGVTVKVVCPRNSWSIFTRIKIHNSEFGFRYLRNLSEGDTLSRGDVERQAINQKLEGDMVTHIADVIGRNLKRSVKASNVVMVEDYEEIGVSGAEKEGDRSATETYVLISNGSITRGQRLSPELFTPTIQTEQAPKDALLQGVEVKHLETTRDLTLGEYLRKSNTKPTLAVRKGEILTLSIVRGMISITAQVRASEGGKIGEVIELENIDSGNLVLGMVVDIGKVELLN